MKIRNFWFLGLLYNSFKLPLAHSKENTLSNIQIFCRCYLQISNKILNTKDQLFLSVKINKIDVFDASMSLLRYIYIDRDLQIKKSLPQQTHGEALAIFHKFHIFHTSWFPNLNLVNGNGFSGKNITY